MIAHTKGTKLKGTLWRGWFFSVWFFFRIFYSSLPNATYILNLKKAGPQKYLRQKVFCLGKPSHCCRHACMWTSYSFSTRSFFCDCVRPRDDAAIWLIRSPFNNRKILYVSRYRTRKNKRRRILHTGLVRD